MSVVVVNVYCSNRSLTLTTSSTSSSIFSPEPTTYYGRFWSSYVTLTTTQWKSSQSYDPKSSLWSRYNHRLPSPLSLEPFGIPQSVTTDGHHCRRRVSHYTLQITLEVVPESQNGKKRTDVLDSNRVGPEPLPSTPNIYRFRRTSERTPVRTRYGSNRIRNSFPHLTLILETL